VIPFTDDAIKLHQSYQAGFNVKCFQNRSAGNVQGGARDGAAPWLLGVLAALLLVFDIFVGVFKGTAEQAGRTLQVTATHVERAYSLLQVIYRIKEMVIAGEAACKRAVDCREGREAQEAIDAASRAEAAERSAAAAPMLWSQGDFCAFSQMPPSPQHLEQREASAEEHEEHEEQEGEDREGEDAAEAEDNGAEEGEEPGSIAGFEASQVAYSHLVWRDRRAHFPAFFKKHTCCSINGHPKQYILVDTIFCNVLHSGLQGKRFIGCRRSRSQFPGSPPQKCSCIWCLRGYIA